MAKQGAGVGARAALPAAGWTGPALFTEAGGLCAGAVSFRPINLRGSGIRASAPGGLGTGHPSTEQGARGSGSRPLPALPPIHPRAHLLRGPPGPPRCLQTLPETSHLDRWEGRATSRAAPRGHMCGREAWHGVQEVRLDVTVCRLQTLQGRGSKPLPAGGLRGDRGSQAGHSLPPSPPRASYWRLPAMGLGPEKVLWVLGPWGPQEWEAGDLSLRCQAQPGDTWRHPAGRGGSLSPAVRPYPLALQPCLPCGDPGVMLGDVGYTLGTVWGDAGRWGQGQGLDSTHASAGPPPPALGLQVRGGSDQQFTRQRHHWLERVPREHRPVSQHTGRRMVLAHGARREDSPTSHDRPSPWCPGGSLLTCPSLPDS